MATAKVNIHPAERIASVALGGALLIRSLTRGSFGGGVLSIPLLYRGVSGHSYLYQVLDLSTANGSKQHRIDASNAATEVERSITVEKPADELYQMWRDPQKLSQIMGDFADVTEEGKDRLHWVLHGPFDKHIEWDTRIVEDRPGQMLRWKSLDGASLSNEETVSFRPAPRDWGTEVTLRLSLDPPGGVLGNKMAKKLSIIPSVLTEKALRRFKSLAETGEIPTLKHNPAARIDSYIDSQIH